VHFVRLVGGAPGRHAKTPRPRNMKGTTFQFIAEMALQGVADVAK
jgi:hypothetical protein